MRACTENWSILSINTGPELNRMHLNQLNSDAWAARLSVVSPLPVLDISRNEHQENMRLVFGCLWGLWKDLKTSKTQRPYIFRETGTFSFRDMAIFERPWRIFQRCTWSFVKTIFGFTWYLYQPRNHTYCTTDAIKSILFKHCKLQHPRYKHLDLYVCATQQNYKAEVILLHWLRTWGP